MNDAYIEMYTKQNILSFNIVMGQFSVTWIIMLEDFDSFIRANLYNVKKDHNINALHSNEYRFDDLNALLFIPITFTRF